MEKSLRKAWALTQVTLPFIIFFSLLMMINSSDVSESGRLYYTVLASIVGFGLLLVVCFSKFSLIKLYRIAMKG